MMTMNMILEPTMSVVYGQVIDYDDDAANHDDGDDDDDGDGDDGEGDDDDDGDGDDSDDDDGCHLHHESAATVAGTAVFSFHSARTDLIFSDCHLVKICKMRS